LGREEGGKTKSMDSCESASCLCLPFKIIQDESQDRCVAVKLRTHELTEVLGLQLSLRANTAHMHNLHIKWVGHVPTPCPENENSLSGQLIGHQWG